MSCSLLGEWGDIGEAMELNFLNLSQRLDKHFPVSMVVGHIQSRF